MTLRVAIVMLVLMVSAVGVAHALEPIAGTTSGVFQNPTGPVGMVTTGVGTPTFTWGTGFGTGPSSLNFAGASFNTSTETAFDVGTLNYFNGTIVGGTEADTVDLNVGVDFTTPSGHNEHFVYTMQLVNTDNLGVDPWQDADYVYLPTLFPTHTFVDNGVVYTLGLTGFYDPTQQGQVPQLSEFHVVEGGSASAVLRGKVTSNIPTVPEPSSFALAISGLGLLGTMWRGRRK